MSVQTESQKQDALHTYGLYSFDSDETYQQGLASILAGGSVDSNASAEVKDEVLRRTRVFYFNKITGNSITMEDARKFERSLQGLGNLESSASNADEENRVLTFAELKDLIESGKVDQIPNNKVIPDKLSDAPPSESTATARKKPWELVAESS